MLILMDINMKWTNWHKVGHIHFSADWSRTATQNRRNMSVATGTTTAPRFTSRSSSVISDATNSSGMFTGRSLQVSDLHFYTVLHYKQSYYFCFVPPQALCLWTAEYLTAPTATSSSTSSTHETCHCKARPDHRVKRSFCDYNNYPLWEREISDLLQLE